MTKEVLLQEIKMTDLIKNINSGSIVLPEFQRSFVWKDSDIKDLLVSILNDYFIGLLLMLRRSISFDFEIRYFEGVNQVNNNNLPKKPAELSVEKVVLDGQQRLTALYYSLYNPNNIKPKGKRVPHRYFLKLNERLKENDWADNNNVWSIPESDTRKNFPIEKNGEIIIKSLKDLLEEHKEFSLLLKNPEFRRSCFKNSLLPISELKNKESFDDWMEDYGDYLSDEKGINKEGRKHEKEKIKALFINWFDFLIPVLTLENKQLFEVAEIFERINRTGVVLSVFALATAVYTKQGINLRKMWKNYYENNNYEVKNFCEIDDEDYPKLILQIMALLQNKEIKKRVIIDPKEFKVNEKLWNEACELLNISLKRIRDRTSGYGVQNVKHLPYRTIIIPLAAIMKGRNNPSDFKKIDTWYWSSVITNRFAGSSETTAKQDYDQLIEFINNDETPQALKEANEKVKLLDLEITDRGALYKGILNLLSINGAQDFKLLQSINLSVLDDHHIFPKKVKLELKNENSILNRTLIYRDTNRNVIKNRKPSDYINEVIKDLKENNIQVNEFFKRHFINKDGLNALLNDNYMEFIEQRKNMIIEDIKKRIKY